MFGIVSKALNDLRLHRLPVRLAWFVLLVGSLPGTAAQAGSVEDMAGNWSSLTLSGSLGALSPKLQKFRWSLINQSRLRDDNPNAWRLSEDLFSSQMGYGINRYASVYLGYVHDWHHPLGKTAYQENRPYQALQFDFSIAGLKAKARTRLEQRINQVTGDLGIRLRQAFTLYQPLAFINPKLSLYLGDEVLGYLNANSFGSTGFSENRAMAGFSFRINRRFGVDLGYLEETIQEIGGGIVLLHNVNANLSYRF